MPVMSCRWPLLFQLVVLIRGHLRRTKTDPVHGVSASVNAASQIDILEAQLHYTDVHAQTHTDRSVGFESLSDSLDHLQKNETQNVSQSWGLHGTIDSGNAFVLNTTEERRGGGWEKHVTPEHENRVQDHGFESPYPFVMVNLDRRIDRLQKMETTLPQWVCAKTCRVSATDSKEGFPRPHYISEEEWSQAYARAKGRHKHLSPKHSSFLLTPGAIALIESSRRVWEQIIFENATTIIVEDDIQVDNPQQLKDALSILHKRTDWEMVFLQWRGTPYPEEKTALRIEAGRSPRMFQGCMKNTGMYALTPAAALKLRDALEKGTWNASIQLDGGYNGYRGIFSSVLGEEKIFHFRPAVAFQHTTGGNWSDIQIIHRGSSTCKINACESRKEVEEKKINITSYSLPNGTNSSLPFREREKFIANFTDRVNASDQVNT